MSRSEVVRNKIETTKRKEKVKSSTEDGMRRGK
jgi:hypothetical protein